MLSQWCFLPLSFKRNPEHTTIASLNPTPKGRENTSLRSVKFLPLLKSPISIHIFN